MCRAIRQVRINIGNRSGGKRTKADRRNFGVDLISLSQHVRLLRFERRKRADLLLEQRLELLGGSQAQLALVGLFACSLRSGLCLQRAAAESVDTLRTSLPSTATIAKPKRGRRTCHRHSAASSCARWCSDKLASSVLS
jgi:hypothetical protein